MKGTRKTKAVFLDRDGTIVWHTTQFLLRPAQLRLLSGVAEAIRTLNQLGFLVIIVTNQPVVSRGLITPRGIKRLHAILLERLERRGARVDAVYFCPHHPDSKIRKWSIRCQCRKPKPGMFLKALKEFNIDPKKSFAIGDGLIDALAGRRAKLKTILVRTGPGHPRLDKIYHKTKPDFVVRNRDGEVKIVKKEFRGK